jgi:hypothetical protein
VDGGQSVAEVLGSHVTAEGVKRSDPGADKRVAEARTSSARRLEGVEVRQILGHILDRSREALTALGDGSGVREEIGACEVHELALENPRARTYAGIDNGGRPGIARSRQRWNKPPT